MEESHYRDIFPLMCYLDTRDAETYRLETLENIGLKSLALSKLYEGRQTI
jgi:hypothetical protein